MTANNLIPHLCCSTGSRVVPSYSCRSKAISGRCAESGSEPSDLRKRRFRLYLGTIAKWFRTIGNQQAYALVNWFRTTGNHREPALPRSKRTVPLSLSIGEGTGPSAPENHIEEINP